ncbi:hypothetical protein BDP55DRAFT_388852 [Colletotrichum godetiae]|uniref:Uncharacterized protein n=1 Tax=Colletotrichum godetiae TaxID=1209918 RepID=A0AAJ0AA39_9PEZI|nr:uncharacterized protein BDP55DRAFT_388852 [Colletotrichum godetiae]KAK1658643.1 hypothetical protein BDP55DRAFT_388852 [Colletotrichum godetiae]
MSATPPQADTHSVFLQGYLSSPEHFYEIVLHGIDPRQYKRTRRRFQARLLFKQAAFSGYMTDADPTTNPMHGQVGLYVSGLTTLEVQKIDDISRHVFMSPCFQVQGNVSLMCNHGTVYMREVTLWIGVTRDLLAQPLIDSQNQQFAGNGSGFGSGNANNIAMQAAQPWDGSQNEVDNGSGSSSSNGNGQNNTIGNNSQSMSQDFNGAARAA